MSGRSLVPTLPLFAEERDRAVRMFNRLRLPDVIGRPRMAEAAGDWFRDIVGALFGAYNPETHERMIQEVFLLVPKKNGKSSYAAAVMVVAMLMNRRPEAEFLLIAPTKEIAGIAYRQARGIILADPELAKSFKRPQDHIKTLTHHNTGATLQIKAADTDVITGSKSTGILVDETHVFSKKSDAADIFVEIRGALAARPDGFMMQITTQSKDPPVGVFKSELAIARDVRDGLIDLPKPRLVVLYELPEAEARDDGWRRPETWPLVNPNLGRSVDRVFLENGLIVSDRKGPEELALFASQHFNIEVGLALRNDAWAGARYWNRAVDETLAALDDLMERSEVCVVGIDGGGLDDLYGLAVIGRCRTTRRWLLWAHAWAQTDVFDQRKQTESTLRDFEAAGDLTVCSEVTQDVVEVAAICRRLADAGLLPEKYGIGVDSAGLGQTIEQLAAVEIVEPQVSAVEQGWRLRGAVQTAERKLKDGTLVHGGQGIMAWCVGNAKAELRGSNILITKQAAGKAKIDPVIAMFNAVSLMSRNPVASQQASPALAWI